MPSQNWLTGRSRSFSGEALREISFPLGGIGTGTVSLGGRGNLRDFEIFNHPGYGHDLPYTFFALWAQPEGGASVARVLERQLLPPFGGSSGPSTARMSGLPRFEKAEFRGEYPLAELALRDALVPLSVSLQAFNPMVPLDSHASGLPIALFRWKLHNTSDRPVTASIAFSVLNACGHDGTTCLSNRHAAHLGRNLNVLRRSDGLTGIFMRTQKVDHTHPHFGTMAFGATAKDVSHTVHWSRAGWWDDAQHFWDDFRTDGNLEPRGDLTPSPDGQTDVGSLCARVTIEPGGSEEILFALAWHFPNLHNRWNSEEAVKDQRIGNFYTTQFADAWEALSYGVQELPRIEKYTRAFHRALFMSTLPEPVIDAISANSSILRTTTCLRTEDGRFHAFEGCSDNVGCCPMNCTHVWNYAQTGAYLYPELERSVRETDFLVNTRPDGHQAFRTLLPMVGELWAFKPAADGQMGSVMRAYREWLQSGDDGFLRRLWPGIRAAMAHAWRPGGWDPNRDGVMEGEQHNTYDIEFYGANTMMGTLYLGALRAAEEMANALGLEVDAREYRVVFERGRERLHEQLWNGDFYRQIVSTPAHGAASDGVLPHLPASMQEGNAIPRYQYGDGCLSDHLIGEWLAQQLHLGEMLPTESVRSALSAIFRHNFRANLSTHESVQRVYAVNDEAGLVLCSWPRGGRPEYPFPYADEVWTGIEYQVASHCISVGLIDEGLQIVDAARSRHAGYNRNPWNEFECGHHYARAMSSWSLLLALSGFRYDAAHGILGFAPVCSDDRFHCYFSAGTGWGVYSQREEDGVFEAGIGLSWGKITLRALQLPLPAEGAITVHKNDRPLDASRDGAIVHFPHPVVLSEGDVVSVAVQRTVQQQ